MMVLLDRTRHSLEPLMPSTSEMPCYESMEPAGSEAFELQPSIWNLIAQSCPSEEQEEVQRILGYAIVEQARDLYDEACTHLEIWNQFKNESEERTIQRFPEPPEVRARLVQEIKFLLEHLERRGQQSVRNGSKKRQQIEDYVKQQRQGQHTPSQSRPSSVASYRSQSAMAMLSDIEGSRSPSLDDEAMRICEHVTVKGIDGVIQNLREALQEECEIRKQEIQFLQGCVEESSQRARKRDNTSKNPSIQDLREFGSELEKEIMEGIGSATVTGPPLVGHHRVRSSLLPPLRE